VGFHLLNTSHTISIALPYTVQEISITIATVLILISIIAIRAYDLAGTEVISILVGIMLAAVPSVLYWGFRDSINLRGRVINLQHKNDPTIGFPYKVGHDGVRHYTNRSKLPFDEMTSITNSTLKMSAITFTALRYNYYRILESLLNRGVTITFLLLNPDSKSVPDQSRLFSQADNLRDQIIDSLGSFCTLQKRFPNQVSIKTYDEVANHSIIIIDDDYIKVEEHPMGSDAEARQNHAAFRNVSTVFYNVHSLEYGELESRSRIYDCPRK
jgi:hypothetical protein